MEREEWEKAFTDLTNWLLFGLIDLDLIAESLVPSLSAATDAPQLRVRQTSYDAIIVRNGGWCSSSLPMSLASHEKSHGTHLATAMQFAMYDTADQVAREVTAMAIDCDFHKGESIDVCRSPISVTKG